jgi:hypothetical protein
LIYVPAALASAFYSLIPGSKRASQYGPGKPPSRVVVTKQRPLFVLSVPFLTGFWTVPCFSVKQIEVSFNELRFAINPRDFYLGRVSASSTDCVAGILSIGNGLPSNLAIIGDEFLKSCKYLIDFDAMFAPFIIARCSGYSTYDYGNGARVGFWPDVNK